MIQIDSGSLNGLALLHWRALKNTSTANTPKSIVPASLAINSITIAGRLVTVIASADHQFVTGQFVNVDMTGNTNASAKGYQGLFSITKTSSSAFTYTLPPTLGDNALPASNPTINGTERVSSVIIAQRVLLTAKSDNSADIVIGPNDSADHYTMVAGKMYVIEMPKGSRFNLGDWYFICASSNQTISAAYV